MCECDKTFLGRPITFSSQTMMYNLFKHLKFNFHPAPALIGAI